MSELPSDKWADWVLDRGHGGQSEEERADLEYLHPIRDRVLENAAVRPGDTVLDVGTGAGLLAFAALEQVGDRGTVIFSDVSQPLLDHVRSVAVARGSLDRAGFILADAQDLSALGDASVDVVTMRSVLIYVDRKDIAFREFHRVLRPGGRLSIFEPINRYFDVVCDEFWGFDATPVSDLVQKLWAFEGWTDRNANADDPMMNFGEHDLFNLAAEAGFDEVHVELVMERKPGTWVKDWETALRTAPNPNAHTMGEVIEAALTEDEAARFVAYMKPLVEAGDGVMKSAVAFLWALKT